MPSRAIRRGRRTTVILKTATLILVVVAWLLVNPSPAQASAPFQGTPTVYTVRAGDTLSGIAARFGTTYQAIMRANNLSSTLIVPGQRLAIPLSSSGGGQPGSRPTAAAGTRYSVRSGDTLWSIATRFGITVEELKQANNIVSNTIIAGQSLRIPPAGTFQSSTDAATAAATSPCSQTYLVRRGDTLSGIAQKCHTTVAALKFANSLAGDGIWTGQRLIIPGGRTGDRSTPSFTWLPAIVVSSTVQTDAP